MKTILITSIAVIALTHAGNARDWAWFRGDIGIASSPFVSPSSSAAKVTSQAVAKQKVASKRAVAASKPNSRGTRITAR